MVTPQELAARQAKAREPVKPVEAPVEEPVEEEAEEGTPTGEEGEGISDEEGSVIDENETGN